MTFKFNPFTDKLDCIGPQPGTLAVETLTGNDSVATSPVANNINLIGVNGITVTNGGAGVLNITQTDVGSFWQTITASQTLAVDNGYICISPGGALALLLPAVSAVGKEVEVNLSGATSFAITQGAGQQIKIGNTATTAGVTGSLTSTQQGDSIRMVCSVANLTWNVISSIGNLTVA